MVKRPYFAKETLPCLILNQVKILWRVKNYSYSFKRRIWRPSNHLIQKPWSRVILRYLRSTHPPGGDRVKSKFGNCQLSINKGKVDRRNHVYRVSHTLCTIFILEGLAKLYTRYGTPSITQLNWRKTSRRAASPILFISLCIFHDRFRSFARP